MSKEKKGGGTSIDKIIKTRFVLMIIFFTVGIYAYLKLNLYWISQRVEEIHLTMNFIDDIFKFMLINNMCILIGIAILTIYYFLSFYQKITIPFYNLQERIIDILVGEGVGGESEIKKDSIKYLVNNLNAMITKFRRKLDEYRDCSAETFGKINDCLNLLQGKTSLSGGEINEITAKLEQIKKLIEEEEKE